MDVGVGLDGTLGLSFAEEAHVSQEAARLRYTSIWTPEGPGLDSFQVCAMRWAASREVVPEGLFTGISVSPVALRTPVSLAMSGGTVSAQTGGRFILGIGSGGIQSAAGRRPFGLPAASALGVMRDYVTTIRALVGGGRVTYEGERVKLTGVKLGIAPAPSTPVYLGALGPKMLGLAGELADGAALNWCTPDQVAWSRQIVDHAARAAGREPADVKLAEYIRVCIDDDEDIARRAFAKATMGYAMGPRGATPKQRSMGYRAHFERMGFADALAELDLMRDAGASADEVAEAFPPELLRRVGYFGSAEGAAKEFARIAQGLDIAIVRVVGSRPGVEAAMSAMKACRPELTIAA